MWMTRGSGAHISAHYPLFSLIFLFLLSLLFLSPPSSPLLMAPGGAARPAEPGSSPTAVHSTPPISCGRVASGRAPCPPQRTSAAAPNAQTPGGGRGTRGGGASPRPRQPTWGLAHVTTWRGPCRGSLGWCSRGSGRPTPCSRGGGAVRGVERGWGGRGGCDKAHRMLSSCGGRPEDGGRHAGRSFERSTMVDVEVWKTTAGWHNAPA
jgi:hypothetical protein